MRDTHSLGLLPRNRQKVDTLYTPCRCAMVRATACSAVTLARAHTPELDGGAV